MDTSDQQTASTPIQLRTPEEYQFEFHGNGTEYFKIWIVNLLFTILTLGIYGPWAKVRKLRYFYGNTVLAGSAFEYHGDPKKILKGRLIAAALILPYYILQNLHSMWSLAFAAVFLVALPFIVVKSRRFQMRMSSWRNIRFDFTGTYGEAAKVFIGWSLLIPLTLGLIIPFTIYRKQKFVIGKSAMGHEAFSFSAQPGPYYSAFFMALGGWIVAMIGAFIVALAVGLILSFIFGVSLSSGLHQGLARNSGNMVGIFVFVALIYLCFIAASLVPGAIFHARTTNQALGNTSIGPHQLACGLEADKLMSLYLGNLLMMFVTLGLFAPWAKIRLLRYQFQSLSIHADGSLEAFVSQEIAAGSATGEELGEFLDVDFGL